MHRNVFYAISISKKELEKYRKLFFLPDCPYYAGAVCCGELFHPRMKGTFYKSSLRQVYDIAMLDQVKNPWCNLDLSNLVTIHLMVNHCTWLSQATFFAIDGMPLGGENESIAKKICTDQLALAQKLRKALNEKKHQPAVDALIAVSDRQTVI